MINMKKYEISIKKQGALISDDTFSVDAGDVMGALLKAHNQLQNKEGLNPADYRLTRVCHVYDSGAFSVTGNVIRSEYPIPGGSNPDVRKSVATQ